MYQVGDCNVVLGEVSFSGDNDLEVVGNKGTELVEGNKWGLNVVGLGHVGVVVCVFAVVWEERQREAHTTDVFVTVEFGRMHDWTSVTTYSVRTFKTCAYQQISRLETLRIECRSQV